MVSERTACALMARLATEQSNQRLPSVVAGLVRDGELIWSGGRGRVDGRHAGRRRPVPLRLDHQDVRRGVRHAPARRGPARASDTVQRFLPDTGHRRADHRPAALPLQRPAGRDRRGLVGAHAGRRPRAADADDPARRHALRGRPPLSLLQRRLRRPRRDRRPSGSDRGTRSSTRAAGPAGDDRTTTRPQRRPRRDSRCIRGPTCCCPSPSTTRARWRRPASCGRPSTTSPAGRRSWPATARPAQRRHAGGDARAASGRRRRATSSGRRLRPRAADLQRRRPARVRSRRFDARLPGRPEITGGRRRRGRVLPTPPAG